MPIVERSTTNACGFQRIDLFEQPEGVYVCVYEAPPPAPSTRDHLQDSWQLAREQCLEDFGVPLDSWHRVEVDKPPY